MEQIQIIEEKKMKSKLLKEFVVRTFTYSLLYFSTIVMLFIFQPVVNSTLWSVLLVLSVNVLFLMMLSKLSTKDAFIGINTTSAPRKSLNRIANSVAVPMFIFTSIVSFIDVLFFHSVFDVSSGYNKDNLIMFGGVIFINFIIWCLVVNVFQKRILRKHLTIEEEKVEEKK